MYVAEARGRSIHLRSRPHSLSFLRFKYWNGASSPPTLFFLLPPCFFFLFLSLSLSLYLLPSVSSIKAPRTILENKIPPRGRQGKKKRFPPINFRSPFRRSCESCESFSSPSRHIISSNIVVLLLPSFSLSLSLSLSVWLAPMYPFVLHSLVQAIPEFVITESREPRNRNFAGYDIRPRSKERPDEKDLPSPLTPFRWTEKDGLNQIYRLPAPPDRKPRATPRRGERERERTGFFLVVSSLMVARAIQYAPHTPTLVADHFEIFPGDCSTALATDR